MALGDDPGGLVGTLQVAGVNRADWLVRQVSCQRPRLSPSGIVEGNVGLTLVTPRSVPGGLTVTGKEQFHGWTLFRIDSG